MRKILLSGVLLAAAAFAGPAMASRESPEARLRHILEGRVAGAPVRCITQSTITSSEVIAGQAIVYRTGGRLYVNRPPAGAGWLRDGDILVTRTINGQLCSVDSVQLIDRASRFPRGTVGLGEFVPYIRAKAG